MSADDTATVGVVATVRALPGREADLAAALRQLVEHARGEPGTVLFALNAERDRPGSFVLFERYRDAPAHLRHRTSAAMELFKARAEGLVAEREVRILEPDAAHGLPGDVPASPGPVARSGQAASTRGGPR